MRPVGFRWTASALRPILYLELTEAQGEGGNPMRASRALPAVLVLLASCSSEKEPGVSQGLKIFVTARVHGGDFANDPFLAGASAVAKADAFCNSDPAKPSAATYKALLVDGVNRDAKTLVNWVLQPNTAYYRAHGTSSSARPLRPPSSAPPTNPSPTPSASRPSSPTRRSSRAPGSGTPRTSPPETTATAGLT